MQAAGLSIAGLSGVYGAEAASAQEEVIRLEARRDVQSPAAYADGDGIVTEQVGVEAATEDWKEGWIDTDLLTSTIDHWTMGEPATGDGGPFFWRGVTPDSISDQSNPALDLIDGYEYTIEITSETIDAHEFVIVDDSDNALEDAVTVDEKGESQSITFTASTEMAEYYCANHPNEMRGTIDVANEVNDVVEFTDVLFLGGVEDGATHYSTDLMRVLTPYMLERGVRIHYTERQDDLNADTLGSYDAVMLYGNRLEPTEAQIDALIQFVEDGGGFVPVHAASASFVSSDRYIDLVGGQFQSHPPIQEVTTDRQQPNHPVFQGVDVFSSDEEAYRHTNVADDITVLEYGAGSGFDGTSNEPWTWTRTQGAGRVFYTAWGHDAVWENDGFKQLLTNALLWASGNEPQASVEQGFPEKSFTNVSEYGHSYIPNRGRETPDAVSSNDDGVWDLVQDEFPVADSMQHSVTPAEFELQYFVSEDILPEGVEGEILDMAFDASGRCFLSLTLDYPNEGGTGEDKIVLCEDTDGDGVADEFSVFQEGLSIPHSLIPHRDGVIAAEVGVDESGRVVYFGDEDGDDVADIEEEIFSGYGTGDTHAGLNQLYRGLDNWIYGVVGYAGLTPSIDESISFSQDVFRFQPDGSEIEFVGSGASNMAGVKTNEEGLLFCSSATAGNNVTTYAAIPSSWYDHINGFTGTTTVDIRSETILSRSNNTNRALPINDRYRAFDFQGGFTAATDQEFYTAREFPEQYWNSTAFVGEGTSQLMSTYYVEQQGAGYESIYHHNLFASNDEWSSPTYVNTGPDGMVWMIDLYDFIFQHNPTPDEYSTGDGNAYETEVRDNQHSRLYRVTTGDDVDLHPHDLSDASASELVDMLSADNMFWRKTAQRKLIEQEATGVVSDLVDLATSEDLDDIGLDPGSIHALWTLDGLDALADNESALLATLSHSSAGVRINALRALPPTAAKRDAIVDNGLLDDDDGRVQMWASLALAETPEDPAAGEAIFEMIDDDAALEEDLLVDASSVGAATHSDGFIDAYMETYGESYEGVNVLEGDGNGGFEEVQATGPSAWTQTPFGGTYTYTWADGTASSGSRSLAITSPSSSDGADAAWTQTVSVEPNTEYTFTAQVKTEDVQTVDGTGLYDGAPLGATISVEQLANDGSGLPPTASAIADPLTGTNDWTELTVSFNSGDLSEIQFNCLFGGYGNATGTAYYDQISVVDPDGNNILDNSDVENGTTEESPTGWNTQAFGETTGEFSLDTSASHTGENSVQISSQDGLDGTWYTEVSIEDGGEYTLVGWVKTENLSKSDAALGALFNVHLSDVETDAITGGTNDWTEVSATFNSGDLSDDAWTDGRGSSIRINALFGGYGTATGTAWFDDVALYDPDGEVQRENLMANPSAENGSGSSPDSWSTATFAGTATGTWAEGTASDGSRSLQMDSAEGADAGWQQTVSVEPNQQYELSGKIKTENLQTVDGTGHGGIEDAPFGAAITVGQIANASYPDLNYNAITERFTGTTDGWQEVSTTFNSGNNQELDINGLYGGYGSATGTAYWDDFELVQLTSSGSGIEQVYNRVKRHEDMTGVTAEFTASATSVSTGEEVTFDASASSIPDGSIETYAWDFGDGSTAAGETVSYTYDSVGDYTVTLTVFDDSGNADNTTMTIGVGGLDPATTIELDGQTSGWVGTAPASIDGQTNPELQLREGEEYTVEWLNVDGRSHNFALLDDSDEVIEQTELMGTEGETQTYTFTATADVAGYQCTPHAAGMSGTVDVI
ncbi:secreted glycosyl hydrolase [Halorubrum saccharovorum DSM 1137]|uniref:Secreted glycosyl hydrolase n=2 Tax=Halorubrum saccharovorum TaxID=2248 RepID=M0E9B4_9EURY|nr:secreted glycosyl hydrolase [Halorubrum saccharovorum DSM 1137]